jgi:hypothetical protein
MTDMQAMEAEAPAEAPAEPIEQSTPEAPQESDDRAALSEVWEKHQRQGIEDDGEAQEAEAEDAGRDEKGRFKAKQPAEKPGWVERPQDAPGAFDILPTEVKREWQNIPEGARSALAQSYQKMASEAAAAGRLKQGFGPIQEAFQSVAQQAPELRNMSPQDAAKMMGELAMTRVQLTRDPVGTLFKVAQQMGVADKFRAAFTGQQQAPQQGQQAPQQGQQAQTQREAALMREVAQMRQQMQRMANPDIITGTVERTLQTREAEQAVSTWAAEKPYYQALEPHLPQFVDEAIAALGEGASYTDVLDAAYNMAVERFSLQSPAPQNAPQDGQRTEAARRAVSSNVRSRGTRPTPLSDRDAMAQAYDRAMKA